MPKRLKLSEEERKAHDRELSRLACARYRAKHTNTVSRWFIPALLQMNEKPSDAASVGVAEDRIVFNLGEGARWKNSRRVLNA